MARLIPGLQGGPGIPYETHNLGAPGASLSSSWAGLTRSAHWPAWPSACGPLASRASLDLNRQPRRKGEE